jgi:hypothetical protein
LTGVLRCAPSILMVTSSISWVLGDLCFFGVLISWFFCELAWVRGVSAMLNCEMGF